MSAFDPKADIGEPTNAHPPPCYIGHKQLSARLGLALIQRSVIP
jgi:hypothetical protein